MVCGKATRNTNRVTRDGASSSSVRVSYYDDVEHPGMLNESETVFAMSYACSEFLAAAGLQDEFNNLCAAAGLTHLMTHQVPQYPKLTYYFVTGLNLMTGESHHGI